MSFNTITINSQNQAIIFAKNKVVCDNQFQNTNLDTIRKGYDDLCNLSKSKKNAFEQVLNFSLNNMPMFQTQERMARRMGYKRRQTANEKLQELWRAGFLEKIPGGFKRPNVYRVAPVFMTHEFIRMAKDLFKCAQVAWHRRLLHAGINISLLMAAPHYPQKLNEYGVLVKADSIEDRTLIKSKLNIKNQNHTNTIPSRSDTRGMVGSGFGKKNKKEVRVNIKKEVFERLKAKGFEFNDAARCDLQMFNAEVVELAAKEYIHWSKKNEANNPFMVFTKICHRISTREGYQTDLGVVGAFKAQYGISGEPNLVYTPITSDNNRGKTSSNGKKHGFASFVDANGVEYWITPDGGRLRKEIKLDPDYRKVKKIIPSVDVGTPWRVSNPDEPETKFHIHETLLAYIGQPEFKTSEAFLGKENMKQMFNEWLHPNTPPENKNTPNLHEDQKTNPDINATNNLSL